MKVYTLPYSRQIAHRHDYASGLTEIHVPALAARGVISRQGKGLAWNVYSGGKLINRTKVLKNALQTLDMCQM